MHDAWYAIQNIAEFSTPALAVFPDRVRENLARINNIAGGPSRVRMHVKTHKMAEVVRMQLAAGITKFKCATVAESEMVARAGAPDVFLSYQPVGPHALRIARLSAAMPQTRFSVMVDDESCLRALGEAVRIAGTKLGVFLDLDNGLHRTGIAPGEAAARLYGLIPTLPGLEPAGLHVYDGHVRDPLLADRIAHAERDFAPVEQLRQQLVRAGLHVPRVVAGGTPTFPVHARHADRECSPGTCIFWDVGYGSKFADLDFLHAAVVVTRVVSKPCDNIVCLDLGYKAIASDSPQPRVSLFDVPDAQPLVHNEEHLAIETAEAARLKVGDVLYGVPIHICPTCALHRDVLVVSDGLVRERWNVVARDRTLTF